MPAESRAWTGSRWGGERVQLGRHVRCISGSLPRSGALSGGPPKPLIDQALAPCSSGTGRLPGVAGPVLGRSGWRYRRKYSRPSAKIKGIRCLLVFRHSDGFDGRQEIGEVRLVWAPVRSQPRAGRRRRYCRPSHHTIQARTLAKNHALAEGKSDVRRTPDAIRDLCTGSKRRWTMSTPTRPTTRASTGPARLCGISIGPAPRSGPSPSSPSPSVRVGDRYARCSLPAVLPRLGVVRRRQASLPGNVRIPEESGRF